MTKIVFAAINKLQPGTYPPERPHLAYELLTIGIGNAPIENDRSLRHRLFNKYGKVPDCLLLEEIKERTFDWPRIKRGWRDFFDILEWKPGSNEPDDKRSQRLARWWGTTLSEYPLLIGNAEPRPGAAVRLELPSDLAVPAHTFFTRLARDQITITTLTMKPGEPLALGLRGDPMVVSRFMADLYREGGLLPPNPAL